MHILADENIPCLKSLFSPIGEVQPVPGRDLSADQVREADILLVRSVTQVNEALLSGSRVKFVGTCTIGIDHLDTHFLQRQGIAYASAPGCNAGGVFQYDLAAMASLRPHWRDLTVGIIGSGNVGGRLGRNLRAMGVRCLAYDPFLALADNPVLTDLQTVLSADIVCVHTPYTTTGAHPTHHLVNAQTLAQLKPGALLINAGRGGAVDNGELLAWLEAGAEADVVLDVWENEPEIDLALMERVALATPHIAGYSFEGRLNGSLMVYDALVRHLKLGDDFRQHRRDVLHAVMGDSQSLQTDDINTAIAATYDIGADDRRLRQALRQAAPERVGADFDLLRKTYPKRREFSHYRVLGAHSALQQALTALEFNVDRD